MKTRTIRGTLALLALLVGGCDRILGLEHRTLFIPDGGGGSGGMGGSGGGDICVPASVENCYDGPPGTQGKGICRAGTKTCATDGKSYGPCNGEVMPTAEDCTTLADEDCDGKTPACKGSLLWAKGFGSTGNQFGTSIAVDHTNNVFVTGYFEGTMNVGDSFLQAITGPDIFVAKLAPDGSPLWAKSFGAGGIQKATSIAADSSGNVLVAGYFDGDIDFGQNLLSSPAGSFFVAKLDPDGKHLWSKGLGTVDDENRTFVTTDNANNVLVTGYFSDKVDFGGGNVIMGAGSADVFVAKLDPDGNHLWSKGFGDMDEQKATSVAVDSKNNVLVTGEYFGSLNFGNNPLKNTGPSNTDIFIAKFDPGGNHLWSHSFGDSQSQGGTCVTADAAGNALLTGYFSGSIAFGGMGTSLMSVGDKNDIFVAKLDQTGAKVWSRGIGDASQQVGAGVAADSAGNVLLTGYFYGSVDFGGGPLTGSIGTNVFVSQLDDKGGHQWSKGFGAAANQEGTGIATDSNDDVLVVGKFGAQIDFGAGPIANAGGVDFFVAKFSH